MLQKYSVTWPAMKLNKMVSLTDPTSARNKTQRQDRVLTLGLWCPSAQEPEHPEDRWHSLTWLAGSGCDPQGSFSSILFFLSVPAEKQVKGCASRFFLRCTHVSLVCWDRIWVSARMFPSLPPPTFLCPLWIPLQLWLFNLLSFSKSG